jgi:hypothetical protein
MATAQNYRAVVPNQEKYFIDQSGFIRGANVYYSDTIGTDTIINNFYAVENDTLHCPPPENYYESYNVYGSSWLGRKIVVSDDGINKFYNTSNEEIVIDVAEAGIWTLFDLGNGDYIEASVDTIIETTVLGNLDSVKTISLQAKDVSNNPIDNIFNGKEIHIGKQSGFVKTFNLLHFPSDTVQYVITDKSKMTRRDVYEYNVGDVVQIKISDYAGSQTYDTLEYLTRTILDKIYSSNMDTVIYSIKRNHLIYRSYFDWQNHITIPFDTTIYIDTVTVSYNMLNNFVFYRMPEESTFSGSLDEYELTSKSEEYNGRRVMYAFYDSNIFNPENDSCYHYCGWCDGSWGGETYIEGLGSLYWSGGIEHSYSEEIVFYQIGNEIYGDLVTAIKLHKPLYPNLIIYPNPATNSIILDLTTLPVTKNSQLNIINALGQTVYQSTVNTQRFSVDVSSLNPGVYFLSINDGEREMRGKFIKE